MNIAIVGCGYVAEFYAKTLGNYPDLKLVGVYDVDEHNLQSFCRQWSVRSYADLQLLLDDGSVEIVLNLTNPRSHYEITRRCIAAGKHVYSEKPLAMDSAAARALVDLAERRWCLSRLRALQRARRNRPVRVESAAGGRDRPSPLDLCKFR